MQPSRFLASALALTTSTLSFVAESIAQEPAANSPGRQAEMAAGVRYAVVATTPEEPAATDAAQLANALHRMGFAVRRIGSSAAAPTAAEVLKALADLRVSLAESDDVLWAWVGGMRIDKKELIFEMQPGEKSPETSTSAHSFAAEFAKLPGRSKSLLIDGPRRALSLGTQVEQTQTGDLQWPTEFMTVFANAAGAPSFEANKPLGSSRIFGLFLSDFVDAALSNESDANVDGSVTLSEALAVTVAATRTKAFKMGAAQRPTIVGAGGQPELVLIKVGQPLLPNPGAAEFGIAYKSLSLGREHSSSAVNHGLRWLKEHQDEDGKWDADGFSKHCGGVACSGEARSLHDTGLTGLALLAFLGDGHHPNRRTPYQRTVRDGVNWLVDQMMEGHDDGLIGSRNGHAFMYDHALATLALCEAYLLSQQANLRAPAQRAVNFILRARNPYKAWRYEAPPNGENDSSITGWMVRVLKTAEDAGLDIDREAFAGATSLFDELTDTGTGRCGYIARGEPPARPTGKGDKFPAQLSESLTAVALVSRICMGETPRKQPMLEAHADLMLTKPPVWMENGGSNDLYYWHYGTFAMFQMGGKYWEKWGHALREAVIPNQRHDGHYTGSWDPSGPWGEDGGRIYSTAMCVLSLIVDTRYAAVKEK